MVRQFITAARLGRNEKVTAEGGVAFAVDRWTRLRRFLILGTDGGTFYAGERELTVEHLAVVRECLDEDGPRTVREIVAIGATGRAPKHDPALIALALATTAADLETRRQAFAAVPVLCRIGTHLLHLAAYREALGGGWGRGFKRAVAGWFTDRSADDLAYQAIKYPSRDRWALSDLLRLTHPTTDDAALNAVFRYVVDAELTEHAPAQIVATVALRSGAVANPAQAIVEHRLPREAIPSELLNDPGVWGALLADMPMTAMVRNLGKMSQVGLLTSGADAARLVIERLGDGARLRRARIHPIVLLSALKVYEQGHGERGQLTWTPVKAVVNALDEAFYRAFDAVDPTGARILCCVDVSASMGVAAPGIAAMTCREVAAAMALVTLATERNAEPIGYSDRINDLPLRPTMRLDEVVRIMAGLPMGGTDCSLPVKWAATTMRPFDAIIQLTDSQTAQSDYPQALASYRRQVGLPVRSIVAAFAASELSLADPEDALALDIAGFDASTPQVMAEMIGGADLA